MNDELQQLEDQLSRLQPAEVPERLKARVEALFETEPDSTIVELTQSAPAPAPGIIEWLRPLASAAAVLAVAALAVVIFNRSESEPGKAAAADSAARSTTTVPVRISLQPVSAHSEIESVRGEGVLIDPRLGPVRRMRTQYRDRLLWRTDDGEIVEWIVPREELRLIPASFD